MDSYHAVYVDCSPVQPLHKYCLQDYCITTATTNGTAILELSTRYRYSGFDIVWYMVRYKYLVPGASSKNQDGSLPPFIRLELKQGTVPGTVAKNTGSGHSQSFWIVVPPEVHFLYISCTYAQDNYACTPVLLLCTCVPAPATRLRPCSKGQGLRLKCFGRFGAVRTNVLEYLYF